MTNEELNSAADAATVTIAEATAILIDVRQVVSIKLESGAELAWSGKRHGDGYKWRLVIRDEDEVIDTIMSLSREEKIEIANACPRLIDRAREIGALDRATRRRGPQPQPNRPKSTRRFCR